MVICIKTLIKYMRVVIIEATIMDTIGILFLYNTQQITRNIPS